VPEAKLRPEWWNFKAVTEVWVLAPSNAMVGGRDSTPARLLERESQNSTVPIDVPNASKL